MKPEFSHSIRESDEYFVTMTIILNTKCIRKVENYLNFRQTLMSWENYWLRDEKSVWNSVQTSNLIIWWMSLSFKLFSHQLLGCLNAFKMRSFNWDKTAEVNDRKKNIFKTHYLTIFSVELHLKQMIWYFISNDLLK